MPVGAWVALGIGVMVASGWDPFHLHHLGHGLLHVGGWLVGGLMAALRLVAGLWAYADAERRGLPGWLVGLGVALVAWPLGAVAWLVLRTRYPETPTADAA